MATGTISLRQNSTAVTGVGTLFTTELSVGDVIFLERVGVNYTLVVSAIASNTALTLARAFSGIDTSGVSFVIVPQAALIGIHAQLAADTAWSRRAAITDKVAWQRVFSSSGQIEVPLPDGSSFSGPSWKYLADNMVTKVDGAVPVVQGGTGATTQAAARQNLSLDRIVQGTGHVQLFSADKTKYFIFSDSGSWGAYDLTAGSYLPLAINMGGTGATTAAGARTNLGFTGGIVPLELGGTGGNSAASARANLGLGTAATLAANTGAAGVGGWFKDTATGWMVQKGYVNVAANTSVAVTLPVSFSNSATCIVVCTIRSSGTSFTSTGDLLGTMDSAGVVRISNTHASTLNINYIIVGW